MALKRNAPKQNGKSGQSKARGVTCPTCFARIGHACEESGRPREPHPDRVRAAEAVRKMANRPGRRKTGANKARLTYTAAPSAEIRAKEARNQAPRPVTIRHDPSVMAWWWTPARNSSVCSECSEPVPRGSAIAFSHVEQRAVCEPCADRLGLAPKVSKAWKRASTARGA